MSTTAATRTRCTLDGIAQAKRLDPAFLRQLGIRDVDAKEARSLHVACDGGVLVPYPSLNSSAVRSRVREYVESSHPSKWANDGEALGVYASAKTIESARRRGDFIIVEGESDCWTLWSRGIPALGVPGSTMTHLIETSHVENIPMIYVQREPDDAGVKFVTAVAKRLHDLGWTGKFFIIDLHALHGFKDASDLHCDDPERFAERWDAASVNAELAAALSPSISSEDAWPELIREVDPEPLPPPMPQELLPEPLRRRVEDVCERMCVPIEMIAAPSIVAIAAVVGRTIGIRPKRRDDWLVVPNLWGGVVARPGLLKTPVIAEALKPLGLLAERASKRFEHDREHAVERLAIAKLEVEVLESQLKGALKKASDEHKIESLREQLATKRAEVGSPPTERRYITHDATIEKLGELLCENPRGLLQLRDELAGWLRLMDRSGHEGDRAFYLEGWNGTGSYTFDRIGRGTIHIPALTLSAFGGITPGALGSYIGEALTKGRGADGLLQRLQVIVWPGTMPEWKNVDRVPDAAARDRVFAIFERLDALVPAKIGAVCGDDSEIPYLRFSPDGQDVFDGWRDELEIRLRSDELRNRPAFESHLAKYRSLMPSLALLFHLIAVADGAAVGEGVSGAAARLAAAWCDYLDLHAERVYASEGPRSAGEALARRIEQGDVREGDGVRSIYRHHWSRLDTVERVTEAAQTLEDLGWLRFVEAPGTGGRPTSPTIRIHPDLRGIDQ